MKRRRVSLDDFSRDAASAASPRWERNPDEVVAISDGHGIVLPPQPESGYEVSAEIAEAAAADMKTLQVGEILTLPATRMPEGSECVLSLLVIAREESADALRLQTECELENGQKLGLCFLVPRDQP